MAVYVIPACTQCTTSQPLPATAFRVACLLVAPHHSRHGSLPLCRETAQDNALCRCWEPRADHIILEVRRDVCQEH